MKKILLAIFVVVTGLFAQQYVCVSQMIQMPLFGTQNARGMMVAIVDVKPEKDLFVYYYKDELLKRGGQNDYGLYVGRQRLNAGEGDVYKSQRGNVYLFAERRNGLAAYIETVNVPASNGKYIQYTIGYSCMLKDKIK